MRIYFMGIGGTAMGNVAVLLSSLGHEVMGSDGPLYPPMSDVLRESSIVLFKGYDPIRLAELNPDLVVIGNVVSRGNPEVEWLLNERTIPYVSLPALMAHELLAKRFNIVVTGTHGKTTTTTLTASLLQALGKDCGYFIGGVPLGLPSGAHVGDVNMPFVIEGDEYDTAFFDKRSKFIHYLPTTLIINNIELDHTDIFRDIEDIKKTFSHVARIVPQSGAIIANGDDTSVQEVLKPVSWTQVYTVGLGKENDLQIKDFEETPSQSKFSLVWRGKHWSDVCLSLPTLFNARNAAMAALATAFYLHPKDPTQLDLSSLSTVKGAKRRQEILYRDESMLVLEDFAHHPTSIRETLDSFRQCYPGYAIIACFEPRSNTARTNVFQDQFTDALGRADQVLIGEVHRADRLDVNKRLNTSKMVENLIIKGIKAKAFDDNNDLKLCLQEYCLSDLDKNKLIVFFSNGSFGGLISEFKDGLSTVLTR